MNISVKPSKWHQIVKALCSKNIQFLCNIRTSLRNFVDLYQYLSFLGKTIFEIFAGSLIYAYLCIVKRLIDCLG